MAKFYREEGPITPRKWVYSTQEFVKYPEGYINSPDFKEKGE